MCEAAEPNDLYHGLTKEEFIAALKAVHKALEEQDCPRHDRWIQDPATGDWYYVP
jgi:hypothetical protein